MTAHPTLSQVEYLRTAGTIGTFPVAQAGGALAMSDAVDYALLGATADVDDFPNARAIISQADTGYTSSQPIGLIAESAASVAAAGAGIIGVGMTSATAGAAGVSGIGKVAASSDPQQSVGGLFGVVDTHAGGDNIAIQLAAIGGAANYALDVQFGDIRSAALDWFLKDNDAAALSFFADTFNLMTLDTTDDAEQVRIGNTAASVDFPYARAIISQADTGQTSATANIGLAVEAVGSASLTRGGLALLGAGATSGDYAGTGINGVGKVSASGDAGTATGLFGWAADTHAGGDNTALFLYAANGANNFAADILGGDIRTRAALDWGLVDDTASALSWDAPGATGILEIDTTNGAEGVRMSGTLGVSGLINGVNIAPIYATIRVAKTGGDFDTIAGALASITDASVVKQYLIKIENGLWTETITGKDYVHLQGSGTTGCIVTSATGPLYTSPTTLSSIQGITFALLPTTNGQRVITHTAGDLLMQDCHIEMISSTNGVGAILHDISGGRFLTRNTTFRYTTTGDSAGAADHTFYQLSGAGVDFAILGGIATASISDQDDNVCWVKTNCTGDSEVVVSNNEVRVDMLSGSYAGNCCFWEASGSPSELLSVKNVIHMESAGAGQVDAYILSSGGAGCTILSETNHIDVEGFTTSNIVTFVDAADTLSSHWDNVRGIDNGAVGPGTYTFVNSPSPGDIQISGSYLNMFDAVKTVGPRGCDYTTIQAALDDNPVSYLLVLVQPGTYTNGTINFTASYQTVMGASADRELQIVTTASSGTICTTGAFTGCHIANLVLEISAGTTLIHNVDCDGDLCIHRCRIAHTTTYASGGAQPACIFGSGTVLADDSTITMNHNGVISAVKTVIAMQTGGDFTFQYCDIDFTGTNSVLLSGFLFGAAGTTLSITHSDIDVTDTSAAANTGIYLDPTTTGDWIVQFCEINVTTGAGVAYGIFNNGSAGADIKSSYNRITCTDTGGTSIGFYTAAGSSITTLYDTVIAADGNTILGSFTYCSSFAEGDFDVSGAMTVGDGGAGDSVINLKTNDTLRAIFGVDDTDDEVKLAGPTGFDVDNWTTWDQFGTITLYSGVIYNTTRITSGPYAVLSTDHVIYADTDGGAFEVDLPAGVEGAHYKIINCGSSGNDVTVDPNGTEQLFGAGAGVAATVSDGEVIDIHYNATEGWW